MKTRICSECLNDFNTKELFIADVKKYSTIYCKSCINKLNILIYKPLKKVSKK